MTAAGSLAGAGSADFYSLTLAATSSIAVSLCGDSSFWTQYPDYFGDQLCPELERGVFSTLQRLEQAGSVLLQEQGPPARSTYNGGYVESPCRSVYQQLPPGTYLLQVSSSSPFTVPYNVRVLVLSTCGN